ncbi:MAG TPA: peptide ABC transporter substrate-binding protein [Usitatibacter sp.]|nr:peptide ABC transporter substrate-binding protein [Usitatibacter sp.]
MGTQERLAALIDEVKAGRMSRREFVRAMLGLGLTAPMATMMLAQQGVAMAQPSAFAYKPTRRGGGGMLKLLWWQGATLLNPHFAQGVKDQEASRIFYEPLAAWDGEGNLVPILAAEIPSRENGGVARDGRSVTWKLKRNVRWHDGKPFTADDVLFNAEYAADPATAAVTLSVYRELKVTKLDDYTVRAEFPRPTFFWADPFVGVRGMIVPKHLFEPYKGAKSREAPTNLKPVGTGPYKFVDFKSGDLVRGAINADYHESNRPHFDSIEMKGGGDAVSAARAVLQTGEFDFAWNMQVEDEILKRLEAGGKGRVTRVRAGGLEMIQFNHSDPWTEIEGERANPKSRHPILADDAVREALNMLVDRQSIVDFIYGRSSVPTRNFLNNPRPYHSPNQKWEYDIEKANRVLEAAGWKRGPDGIRARDGRKLKFLFQTATNAPRQKTQAIIKAACQKAGIELELKATTASVFFSTDLGNPDTYTKFYADLQMYGTNMRQPDPDLFMTQFVSTEASSKANKWQGRNISRWRNEEYDRAYRAAESELDAVKRAALFVRMNELIIDNRGVIPLMSRYEVNAVANKLQVPLSGWDSNLWLLKDWFREA